MRNDTERLQFIQNPDNWEEIGQVGFVGNPLIRLSRLEYKGHKWFKTEVWQTYMAEYDYEIGEHVYSTGWHDARMYRFDPASKSFRYSISVGRIKDEIKNIDRKEKENDRKKDDYSF